MISALFVRTDSVYKQLGIDCWDIKRDALKWPGGNPAILHPPCRLWGKLRAFANVVPGERELAIWSVNQVRTWGGVLEHPRGSKLWSECRLPTGGDVDSFGGFTLNVNQHWWGHRAEKRTLLYIVGVSPSAIPAYPLSFNAVTHCINWTKDHTKKHVNNWEREATPIAFAEWLIKTAGLCSIK